jgi:hypothetical protein
MNDERDPALEALFSQAEEELPNGDFAARVMASVNNRRRNVLIGRVSVIILIVVLELALSAPVSGALGEIVKDLGEPLIDLNDSWFALLIAPLNSVAGVVGMILLLIHFLYRWVIR